MMISSYPGDERASAILKRAECYLSIQELKAVMAGAVMGLELVKPSEILDHIEFGGINQPDFGDKKLAEDFLQVFFGLWNEMAKHQDPSNPFSFSKPNPS